MGCFASELVIQGGCTDWLDLPRAAGWDQVCYKSRSSSLGQQLIKERSSHGKRQEYKEMLTSLLNCLRTCELGSSSEVQGRERVVVLYHSFFSGLRN
ncbi:SH3 domain-binding glutamic acid-rich-like protein 2 isoform X2 [Aotus nancymaae]|uniref:SH3 domain-binding glutamic acid-rich-like protein 2 isoform X2 n=1 Tax=Aotus nancymaae TaxID=37293 RepID=UPI0030FE0711